MERDEPVCKIAFIETANITYPDKVISIILYKAQTHFGSQESDSKCFLRNNICKKLKGRPEPPPPPNDKCLIFFSIFHSFPNFKIGLIVKYLVELGQSLGWDRRARIQLGQVHLGVDTFWENLYFLKYS